MAKVNSFLRALIACFDKLLEFALVGCMVVMFVLVFINVIMRIFFNSGIDVSEELPRFAFVWMTFIGAVVGLRKRTHLGVDMLIVALPVFGRKVCWAISQAIMFVCSLYMFYGTWMQHDILYANTSSVMQISLLWVYGISYLTGFAIALICAANLVRLAMGLVQENELIEIQEEGADEANIEQQNGGTPA